VQASRTPGRPHPLHAWPRRSPAGLSAGPSAGPSTRGCGRRARGGFGCWHRQPGRKRDEWRGGAWQWWCQPCEPQGWCRVESFSLHLRRGVNDEIFLLRSTFPHQRCYISTTREPSVPVACGCIPCAPQARPPAPCSVRLLTCRIHFCAKSRPLGETITDPVSQPHYASCLAGPSERITKA
jgi:hypothetical protein